MEEKLAKGEDDEEDEEEEVEEEGVDARGVEHLTETRLE